MAYTYSTFTMRDLGAGIDQQSSEDSLREGYAELLLNADPEPMGYLTKRVGYQRENGQVPVRVTKVEYSTGADNNLCFFLDSDIDVSAINLLNTRRTPLVLQGRTSPENTLNEGDFPNDEDSVVYYPTFNADIESNFSVGQNTLANTGIGTEDVFVHTSKREFNNVPQFVDKSNTVFLPDQVRVSTVDGSLEVDYDNGTGNAFEGYIYVSDKTIETGTTYKVLASDGIKATPVDANNVATGAESTVTEVQTGRHSYSVPTSDHGLSNFNIDTRIYEVSGTDYLEVQPDEVIINAATGDVSFIIENNDVAYDAAFYLTAYPVANVEADTVAATSSIDITLTGLTSSFIGVVAYLDDEPANPASTIRRVIPDSIQVDDISKTATVSFTNTDGTAKRFIVYWEDVEITSNKLCVDAGTVSQSFTDTEPQLTIWGLDHSTIYGVAASSSRPGWVTHLDSYKAEGENRLVCGLGGNLFTETTDSLAYKLPTLYPKLSNRCSIVTNLGPTFYATGTQSALSPTVQRSRGWLEFDDVVDGFTPVTSIVWNSGNSVTYTIDNITSSKLSLTPGSIQQTINFTSNLEDYLTIKNAPLSKHNGVFRITNASSTGSQLVLTVENPNINCADFNVSASSARAGIFTDQVPLLTTSEFQDGDQLASDLFEFDAGYDVVSSSAARIVVETVSSTDTIPTGLLLIARRTSNIFPLRSIGGVGSVEDLVAFDSVSYTGLNRRLTARFINTRTDEAVTIVGDGTTATITLDTSANTDYAIGQTILLNQAGTYSGPQVISGITAADEVQFASTSTESTSGTILGKTVVFDEVLTIADSIDNSVTFSVPKRWAPIEAPTDSFAKTPSTYTQHFDTLNYGNQPYLRSVMVSNNLYLTNGYDEVMKHDGQTLYRAGLFRWQPHLFITVSTAASDGKIQVDLPTATVIAGDSTTKPEIISGDASKFTIGDRLVDVNGNRFTLLAKNTEGTNDVLELNNTYSAGTSNNLTQVGRYRYYFRLNAIDANGNQTGSAITGLNDTIIEITASSQIRIRLVGLPAWHIYDYDRLEVEVYRTQLNQVASYRKVVTLPIQFNENEAYIDFADDTNDDLLLDLDGIDTALTGGSGIGTQYAEPMRASYITSAGNRLVLANLIDYPELNIKYESNNLSISNLVGGRYLFRKDNTDITTTSDLETVQGYEFVDSTNSQAITSIANNSDTSFTVTDAGHSVSAGNWVYLYHAAKSTDDSLQYAGWFQVDSVPDANTFTILHNHTETSYTPSAADVDTYVQASSGLDLPVFLGDDFNYAQESYNPTNSVDFDYTEVSLVRLANAINTSMRVATRPWMIAGAGGDYAVGQLLIRQPRVESTFLEVQVPSYDTSKYSIFVNSVKRGSETQASARIQAYPSRLIFSGNNYPEMFINPRAALDTEEDATVIDVNAADGEQITGVVPFFGDSAFGAAQKDGILVVFKESSIYLVNLAEKESGRNAVQKLESQGLGCTAPYSIASTRDGILFANRSGIYKLTRDLRVNYVGQKIERLWESDVNRSELDEVVGHHYSVGRQYKLSYPTAGQSENSEVFVYNHTREYTGDGVGSWTRYDSHPATGWCNLLTEAYFSTTSGAIMKIRSAGDNSDFRDDASSIQMEAIFRALDFGDAGIRKVISNVVAHFRNATDMQSSEFLSAVDLSRTFQALDSFKIVQEDEKVYSVQFSVGRRKGLYFQLKLTNNGADEPVELTSLDIRVAGLSEAAIRQAAFTTR